MKKKKLAILFLVLLPLAFASAEDSFDFVNDKSLGFSSMMTYDVYNCWGISYQQWFKYGIGLQVTAGGGFAEYNMDNLFCAQLELQKMFFAHKFKRSEISTILFGWLAGGFTCYEDDFYDYEYDEAGDVSSSVLYENFVTAFGFGLGLGVDVVFSDYISLPISMGFMGSYSDKLKVHFAFGSGLRYRF